MQRDAGLSKPESFDQPTQAARLSDEGTAGRACRYPIRSRCFEAVDKVEVRPLVTGTIVAVYFKDGALVKKGDRLFSIDPGPYAAEVDRTAAQLAAAQAQERYATSDAAGADRLG
ncbi:biotin/lipoyl-binding protein [Caballeronia sp. LZ035]|nr:biotin/lipoyl-binding protein [Caballeronia sp. LZ035]MDR5758987.1 biotin/lipoyl-binding protein [Caballeronia sp. LZ035]